MNPANVRHRILAAAVARANEQLEKVDATPLPENLTPHKLRYTFASVLVALGTDPGAVMDQLGQTDPGFTLQTYRHGMRRDELSKVVPIRQDRARVCRCGTHALPGKAIARLAGVRRLLPVVAVAQSPGELTGASLRPGSKRPQVVARARCVLSGLGAASPLTDRHSERGPGFRRRLCATATVQTGRLLGCHAR